MNDWISISDAFKDEAVSRADINVKDLCTYGIKPLDDSLVCINKNELVVIGADTGVGKSGIALNIARTNVKKGKKVAMYYLEGGYQEAISRMKWRDTCEEYYKNYSHLGLEMDYRKWSLNMIHSKTLMEIENKVWEKYKRDYKDNLYFYSARKGMTVDSFISSLLEFHKLVLTEDINPFNVQGKLCVDLVIIDHLQYFSLTKSENEIFEITEILRTVKGIADNFNVPVVLISHLRKKAKDRGFPGIEDFYGSSNIPKIASTAITLAPSVKNDDIEKNIYPTYIRVAKSRIGVKPSYAFLIDFYLNERKYSDTYSIHKLDNFGHILEPLEEKEKPRWSRRHYERGTETTD